MAEGSDLDLRDLDSRGRRCQLFECRYYYIVIVPHSPYCLAACLDVMLCDVVYYGFYWLLLYGVTLGSMLC
jgi:hypothetical protein